MVYDAERGRVVLFGGASAATGRLSDTWEWDGEDWIQRYPATIPPERYSHYLTFDSARHRTVLFGGLERGLRILSDTWEWDGNDWIERHPNTSPLLWNDCQCAFASSIQRTVLFGPSGGPAIATAWLWDGQDWSSAATPGMEPRGYGLMVWDSARERLVLYGGLGVHGEYRQDTWEWDGTSWILASPDVPARRIDHAIAYDASRGRTVLFGGMNGSGVALGDTWEWDGAEWQPTSPVTSPSPRSGHATAFDSFRRRTVLFGGKWQRTSASPAETWEWDGEDWIEVITERGPIDRIGHAMAFDSRRGRTVLFGGASVTTGRLGDTWEWDGVEWVERTPSTSPSPRWKPAMAYDAARGVTVLFGGADAYGQPLSDTWEWNGTRWRQCLLESSPSPRFGHSLAFDRLHRRVVLFGGGPIEEDLADTWAWDGSDWVRIHASRSPDPRGAYAMAFDEQCGEVVLYGGLRTLTYGTWTLGGRARVLTMVPIVGSEDGGDLLCIDGSGFTDPADTIVTFGGAPAQIVDVTCWRVTVRTPPGQGSVDVVLRNSFGAVTIPPSFRFVARSIAARFGTVGAARERRDNVLMVDGNVGDLERELTARASEPLWLYVTPPAGRAESCFVLYAWIGQPDAATLTTLPRACGAMIFPTPLAGAGPQPRAIWNNVGRFAKLGHPSATSSPAPSLVYWRDRGPRNPVVLAFQGLIEDDDSLSPDGFSVTNAVVLHVVP